MGERLNDGAGHSRRRAHPVDAAADDDAPAAAGAPGIAAATLEALLGQALRDRSVRGPGDRPDAGPDAGPHIGPDADSDGERRAVAAFRAARDAGAHKARTRRRDDWRPRARRHTARSLRATLSVLVAGLALGGAAFAAVGSSTDDVAGGAGRPGPSATASGSGSADTASVNPRPAAPADRDRPASAEDTEAHCRAYEKVRGRGKAMDSTAWQRLVTAAGGEKNVVAYCRAAVAASASAGGGPKAGGSPKAGKAPEADKTEQAGRTPKAETAQKTETAQKSENAPKAGKSPKAGKTAGSGAEGQ
ncbi:hypothetical protein ACFU6S_33245 [Streptomyces sp. NPDC057456]|uniref:hypothetical protein n=1 Tax=Streptomyces sp. NPDC057456 TaxID=3346139 RepID=UPI0036CD7019